MFFLFSVKRIIDVLKLRAGRFKSVSSDKLTLFRFWKEDFSAEFKFSCFTVDID